MQLLAAGAVKHRHEPDSLLDNRQREDCLRLTFDGTSSHPAPLPIGDRGQVEAGGGDTGEPGGDQP